MHLRVKVVEDSDGRAGVKKVLDDKRPDETSSARHKYAVVHRGLILAH
jgi:hypothetical protein